MTATNHIQSSSKALGTYPSDYSGSSKALSHAPTKNLGDPALASWLEQAYAYYNAVMSGAEPAPDQMAWAEFMNQLSWATSQNGGGFGDPMMGGYGQPMGPQQQPLPPGATPGANGNAVYDQMDANIEHTQFGQPIDVYSNNIVLNSGSMMTTFTCEVTTDTRLNPAEQVLKITASDGTVYFVHDFEDANIVIKTPVEDMVNTGGQPNVSWEQYSGAEGGASGAGLTGGEVEKVDETHSIVTAGAGEVIDAVPNKNVDETQFYTVYGELNVSLPADCTADITKNAEGDSIVTVKDRDGKVIAEYTVKSGFPVNVNHANEKSITINGNPVKMGEDEEGNEVVENGWEGLSINGVADDGSKAIFGTITIPGGLGIGGANSAAEQYSPQLTALADFIFGKHDQATMDQLIAQLQSVFGADYEKAMLNVPAGDRPSFTEWVKSNYNSLFDLNKPSEKVIQFLFAADPTLASLYGQVAGKQVEDVASLLQDIQTRLIADLQQLGYCPTAAQGRGDGFPGDDVYGIKIGNTYFTLYDPRTLLAFDDARMGSTPGWYSNPNGVDW